MSDKLDKLLSNMSSMMKIYDVHKVLDKKKKSNYSEIFPKSWFKHFTELLKKTSEHHFIPEYTYLPIKTFQSVMYSVHGVITIQNHPGPN